MVRAKTWTLRKHFEGFPQDSDFELKEQELPEPKDGEVLLEAVFLSVDPYMRPYSKVRMKEGDVMIGSQVANVSSQEHRAVYRPATEVYSSNMPTNSWSVTEEPSSPTWPEPFPFACFRLTALYGLTEVCEMKPGDVVLVNAAAGAVGSVVGQIAKIKGCKAVGCAGSDSKVAYLKEMGFDEAFNYKTVSSLEEALKKASPEGYDCFFENVSCFSAREITQLCSDLRCIGVECKIIFTFFDNIKARCSGPYVHPQLLFKQLRMEGFLVYRWKHKNEESLKQLMTWVKEGKLKYREHITAGFANMPRAFMGMLKGENTGKAIVKA
uniref:15-oxoprostaglandin 13-reductase n=1 Tax=Lepisosteus oculatus TaxID=7918 RepID=W5N7A0_LEPOC